MEAYRYFKYLVEEIHTTIVATVDDDGLPITAAIDMMDYDEIPVATHRNSQRVWESPTANA